LVTGVPPLIASEGLFWLIMKFKIQNLKFKI
jgi:hypothetical protein